ncbi:TetR/AcrR family transcriptional regulator [Terriglobus albidus]|uniref:TetR/AcrR family transcriptional regulator n=1 Tax=Terriglobus albidus TaxID=1592106 RepID=UPI0021DFE5FD|nr:TetR/AcrR family transcriptional regulator [Terriglobus albidus]
MEPATQAAPCSNQPTDPRIRRTRQMLQGALVNLLTRKHFNDISISDIAAQAGVNRATFYLHYTDKHALLQAMTESRFRELLDRRGVVFSCEGVFRSLALGVCDFLSQTGGCPEQLASMPLETSIIPVVEGMILHGFQEHPVPPETPTTLIAATVAWAIFGAAKQWIQTPNRPPAEEVAATIETLVKPIFPVIPEAH